MYFKLLTQRLRRVPEGDIYLHIDFVEASNKKVRSSKYSKLFGSLKPKVGLSVMSYFLSSINELILMRKSEDINDF